MDPSENRAIWDLIDRRAFAVSKSGQHGETSNSSSSWEKLRDFGRGRGRIAIADQGAGRPAPLREPDGLQSLILPGDVGGRFSVLTVGL